ncbi:MAG: hypothetical protein A2339_08035 [Elusimicrobia bacterium RIFOXYB12_FULL_50_12]|nr:MAG: hypothetical protein A2278_02690 [Elusimicrobia bacterium RIFOXYA12_FULL_49_49]OGS16389.1 MAG: hypothetical protein A2251_06145 [Elusimicrobia bacterium RIFOXYA2_FULL_47_53]OGS27234.1 MAG: hypothetical protein A2339_08035 [Elusimicrobia bacterium RIFOXYB12_FULL_50_12]OGS30434.1 MAG: hypothetical protein A2323_02895 [Elusimicrobia bacterium RIFOXYB2_FULL_46_23]
MCLPSYPRAEALEVNTKISRGRVTIAEPLDCKVSVRAPFEIEVSTPQADSFGPWALTGAKTEGGGKESSVTLTLLTYTTGQALLPRIPLKVTAKDGRVFTILSSSAEITVESLLDKYGDAGDIRDIKKPLSIPHSALFYVLWLIAALLAAAGVYLWRKKRRSRGLLPAQESVAPEHPLEKALRELEELKNSGLLDENKIKEFYIALFDIVRDYFAGSYGIETRDRTSAEIYADLKAVEADKKLVALSRDFFERCDMVKFAKLRPEPALCREDWDGAKTIVEYSSRRGTIS